MISTDYLVELALDVRSTRTLSFFEREDIGRALYAAVREIEELRRKTDKCESAIAAYEAKRKAACHE